MNKQYFHKILIVTRPLIVTRSLIVTRPLIVTRSLIVTRPLSVLSISPTFPVTLTLRT